MLAELTVPPLPETRTLNDQRSRRLVSRSRRAQSKGKLLLYSRTYPTLRSATSEPTFVCLSMDYPPLFFFFFWLGSDCGWDKLHVEAEGRCSVWNDAGSEFYAARGC
jgi:hypothetical protein